MAHQLRSEKASAILLTFEPEGICRLQNLPAQGIRAGIKFPVSH